MPDNPNPNEDTGPVSQPVGPQSGAVTPASPSAIHPHATPSSRNVLIAVVLLVVGFVALQVHATRLQGRLDELHRRATLLRGDIELGTQVRRDCRRLYVALLEHWHGQGDEKWQSMTSEVLEKANTLAASPNARATDADGAHLRLQEAVNAWVDRLRGVIEHGEGSAALEEMRKRQGQVDEWANRVIDTDIAAAALCDQLHGAVRAEWGIVEAIAASLLLGIGAVAVWWRARVRAASIFLEQTLREKERAARSQFFTNMSHELRTPLVSMGGFAAMIEDNPSTAPEVRGYAQKINHVSRELLAIINNILDVAKLESDHMKFFIEPVAIQEVLERCIARAEGLIGHKELTLELVVEPGVPRVRGDFVKLQQVFTNIIGNAVKFTEKGRVITRVRSSGKQVVIDVKDTGIGIDDAALQTIWEPFRQVDHKVSRKFGGSGLGLAIVHAVVTRLGGTVSVRSAVGVGTTFRVSLPMDGSSPTDSRRSLSSF